MADTAMTYGNASDLMEAVRVLEAQEAQGTITRTGQVALDTFRARRPDAQAEIAKTRATYRGLGQGATLGGGDELTSAIAAMAGGNYDEALAKSRALNEAAQVAYPEEYASGKAAGALSTAGVPIGGAQALAAKLGLGLLGRTALGAAEGAALGAAPGFLSGEGGFVNRAENIDPWMTGAGAVLGAGGVVGGQLAGAAARRVQDASRSFAGYAPKAARIMASRVGAAERAGADIVPYLESLGPEGMIADIPGRPMATAQGLASMGGEGGDILTRALNARAAAAGPRIERTVEDVAGAPNRAYQERTQRAQERTNVLGPEYEAAMQYQHPIDVRPILGGLFARRENMVGDARTAIDSLAANLAQGNGVMTAERLHNVRSDLNGVMQAAYTGNRRDVYAALKPFLNEIDAQLDTIPGYAGARTGYGNSMAMDRAAKAGREVFGGTARTAMLPEEFGKVFGAMSPAEQDAFKAGAREYIAGLMGTARNAPATVWGEFSKGFNADKLRIMFGDDEANRILQTLKGEQAFSNTKSKVLEGSQSAQRLEASQDLADVREPDTGRQAPPMTRVKRALIDEPMNAVINSILYGKSRTRANADIGKLLTLQGAERDSAVQALLREAQRQQSDTRTQALARNLVELVLRSGGAAYTTSGQ